MLHEEFVKPVLSRPMLTHWDTADAAAAAGSTFDSSGD